MERSCLGHTVTAPERAHRSVSQLQSFKRCGYAYKLSRIDKVWERPAAWLAMGSAVHEGAEVWEKSGRTLTLDEVKRVTSESYAAHIEESTAVTPNLEYWHRSGPYDGEVDVERRYGLALEHVERLVSWHLAHPDQTIWVAEDGTPAIEIGFDFELDGVLIRGFIDAVRVVDGEPRVVDYKSGAKVPDDPFQLGVYKIAMKHQYGLDVNSGEYFMTKTGKPTFPYDLSEYTTESVSAQFSELEDSIQAGRFEPSPEPSKCRMCSVSLACEFNSA